MSGHEREKASGEGAPKPRDEGAVALVHDPARDRAPRVVASGYGKVAERIVASARDHGIFVHDSPELVALLMNLDLDELIPQELYLVVAELLVWVAELERTAENTALTAPH